MEVTNLTKDVSDLEYFSFSEYAYDRKIKIDKSTIFVEGEPESQWKVIDKWDDEHGNGSQAIALARLDSEGKVDTSNIVISYRGTEFMPDIDVFDLEADISQVVFKSDRIYRLVPDTVTTFKVVASEQTQFKSALQFANRISSKYKTATITHTGHSLGGGQSQYVGAEREEKAVSFAAPNVYGLLSDEAKKRVDSGETREYIRDYVHSNDLIGMFTGGDPLIGKEYIVANNVEHISLRDNPIAGHYTSTYTGKFNGDGRIQFRMEPKEVIASLRAFKPHLNLIMDWRKRVERYIEDDANAARAIYQKMLSNVNGSGKYHLLSEQDIQEVFRKNAMTIKGSDYYFIDVDLAMDFCYKLKKFEQKMEMFVDELMTAAETTGTLDKEISFWFRGI